MKKWCVILVLATVCHVGTAPLSLRAADPVAIGTAAPQALELASLWSPHAINAMQSGGIGLVKTGEALINIFRLPLGVLQCTAGYPFGYGSDGLDNCVRGVAAPFELVFQVLMLPVRILSLGAVR